MPEKLEIVIKRKDKEYHAYIKRHADSSENGNTIAAALGNLLFANQELFSVSEITTVNDDTHERTGVGGYKLPSTKARSSMPGRGW